MPLEPGVYRSDVEGHLLVLKEPLAVACVVCAEACVRADYKLGSEFQKAAKAFVDKHGALDERIGNSILELISVPLTKGNPCTSG